jgi:hypothetical protein
VDIFEKKQVHDEQQKKKKKKKKKKKRRKKAPKGEDSYCRAQQWPSKQVFIPSNETVVSCEAGQ